MGTILVPNHIRVKGSWKRRSPLKMCVFPVQPNPLMISTHDFQCWSGWVGLVWSVGNFFAFYIWDSEFFIMIIIDFEFGVVFERYKLNRFCNRSISSWKDNVKNRLNCYLTVLPLIVVFINNIWVCAFTDRMNYCYSHNFFKSYYFKFLYWSFDLANTVGIWPRTLYYVSKH